jgi:hypothetical protein
MVDDHSFRIDKYVNQPHTQTLDRAFYKDHYYSDKIIGLSLLGAPVYWALERVAGLAGRDPKPDFSRYVLTVLLVSLSSSLLSILLLRFLILLGQSLGMATLVTLFMAFGTLLFPFSSLFYPYLPSLLFLLTAFYCIVAWHRTEATEARPPWLPGALAGLAMLCEYTLAVPAVLIGLYYFFTMRRRRRILGFMLAAAVPLAVFALYNLICFDHPFSIPYQYLENPEFKAGMSQGLMGIHHFQCYVLWLITLHPYRGIFFYSPFLLLAFAGIARGLRRPRPGERGIAALVLAICLYYLGLNASYYMWWGGGTLLARHLIPMLPFLGLAFAWLPGRLRKLFLILGLVSVGLMFPQSVVEPHFEPSEKNEDLYRPWETVQRQGHGLTPPFLTHSLPAFLKGRISINPFNHAIYATDGKLWTLVPLLAVEAGLLLLLYHTVRREAPDCLGRADLYGRERRHIQ